MCEPINRKEITNEFGITFKQLKEFINEVDSFVPDESIVTIDMINRMESNVLNIIADDEGVAIYDNI